MKKKLRHDICIIKIQDKTNRRKFLKRNTLSICKKRLSTESGRAPEQFTTELASIDKGLARPKWYERSL